MPDPIIFILTLLIKIMKRSGPSIQPCGTPFKFPSMVLNCIISHGFRYLVGTKWTVHSVPNGLKMLSGNTRPGGNFSSAQKQGIPTESEPKFQVSPCYSIL